MLVTSEPPPIGLLASALLVALGGDPPPVDSVPLPFASAFSTSLACSLPVLCDSLLTVGLELALVGVLLVCVEALGVEAEGSEAALLVGVELLPYERSYDSHPHVRDDHLDGAWGQLS